MTCLIDVPVTYKLILSNTTESFISNIRNYTYHFYNGYVYDAI